MKELNFVRYETGENAITINNQLYKMVKHTQTICRQQPANCLTVFDHFVGLVLKGLTGREPNEEGIFHNFKATSAA